MAAALKATAAPATKKVAPETTFTLTQTVGERIRWARERKKLTQKELSARIDKCRATMVQYEQGKIAAPVNVIEDIAEVLGVAPEYLAFGRTGLPGKVNAPEDIVGLEELTKGRDGVYTSGGWGLPKSVFPDYQGDTSNIKIIVATLEEPQFQTKPGDRYFVDTSTKVDRSGFYLLDTVFGYSLVRVKTSFTNEIKIVSGEDGTEETLDLNELTVVGRVVGVFRHTG